jgi:hypothetical protein
MTVVFKTNSCTIEKKNNTYKFSCEDGEKYSNFFDKIKKKLPIVGEKHNTFTVKDIKVETLKNLIKRKGDLSYRHLKWLFTNLVKQFEGLEEDGYCNLFFNIEDIVRVEIDTFTQKGGSGSDIYFLYLNTTNFLPIKDDHVRIITPFEKKNNFFSPEMKKIKAIPSSIHINSQTYSLALLTCFCMRPEEKIKKTTLEYFEIYLASIANTRLYMALLRCLQNKPKDRVQLYI